MWIACHVRIGAHSALMKEFRGSITDITYSSDIVPPCLLRTSVSGDFGHLDRLELLSSSNTDVRVFQEPNSTAPNASNGGTGNRLLDAVRVFVKPEERDAYDRNEMKRDLKDERASSSELGKPIHEDGKKVDARVVQSVPGQIARTLTRRYCSQH